MIEILLAVITGVLTVISTFVGAIAINKSKCHSECCDIVLQTSPIEEDIDID